MSRSRLQEEQSAETRARLLEAAIACLSEKGYAGATVTEIAGRAGLSRGAQIHHFPKKEGLVIGAAHRACAHRIAELELALQELPDGSLEYRLGMLIDLLWVIFRGPSFYAWLELLVASRTEPMLRAAMRDVSHRFRAGVGKAFAKFLERGRLASADVIKFELVMQMAFGKLESMALERAVLNSDEADPPELLRALQDLKKLVREVFNSTNTFHYESRADAR